MSAGNGEQQPRRTSLSKRHLRGVVTEMDSAHVDCRDLTHAWQPHTVERNGRGYKRTLLCPRCGTERVDHLRSNGAVIRRRYVYTEGYVVRGMGPLTGDTKNMMRLEALKRMLSNNDKDGDSA